MPNNELHTPVDLARTLKAAVGGFDLDPASGPEPEPIAETRYTKADDGLSQPWFGKVFVNPPYERYVIDEWAKKVHDEARRQGGPWLIVALVPARVNTDWWHTMADDADFVFLLNNRLRFGDYGSTGRYPYAIVVYGDWVPESLIAAIEDENGRNYSGSRSNKPVTIPRLQGTTIGTPVDIELDDRSIGFPGDVDAQATAYIEAARDRDDGVIEVLAIQPQDDEHDVETYYLLHFSADDPSNVRCSVDSMELRGWRDAPVSSVTIGESEIGTSPFCRQAA